MTSGEREEQETSAGISLLPVRKYEHASLRVRGGDVTVVCCATVRIYQLA